MTAKFVTRKQNVSENEKEIVNKKLEKLSKFFPDDVNTTVNFIEMKNDRRKVELTIFHKDTFYRSEIEDRDYISAIEKAVDVIEGQIRKNKTKLKKRLRDGAFDKYAEAAEPKGEPVRTKIFNVGRMDTDEAILEMELSDHSFYIFKNSETEKLNIVYKRKDGEYGLIIPE